jgi:hypothetical protein
MGTKVVYKEKSLLASDLHLVVKPAEILFYNMIIHLGSLIIPPKSP